MIDDTSQHPIVSKLEITQTANIGSYLGVPIILDDDTMFGTLCAIDPSPYMFKNSDLELMQTLANFIGNAIELGKAYEKILLEEKRVKKELDLAKKVQTSVLPEPIHSKNIKIDAFYKSSESLSGDMYSWFKISPTKYGIILLDVMGHGVSASLISMSIRSLLRGIITSIIDPAGVMKELNHHIYHLFNSGNQSTYATSIYILIDTESKTIDYVNAGHPSGLLLRGKSELNQLDRGCIVLGIFPEIQVSKYQFQYEETSTVLLYTDGILELISPAIKEGIHNLETILLNHPNNQELIEEIQTKFVDGKCLKDDICLIGITVE